MKPEFRRAMVSTCRIGLAAGLVLAAASLAAAFQGDGPTGTPQASTSKTQAAPLPPAPTTDRPAAEMTAVPADKPDQPVAASPEVDRILTRAEKAGETIETLETDFDYRYDQNLIDEHEWRMGRMIYKKPSRVYIEFTDGGKETFRFDGRVYIEDRPQQKQRYVHIFRKPGDKPVSVLDVEEMPFPHPFGTKRDTLLKDYTIEYKGKEKLAPWTRPKSEGGESKEAVTGPADDKEYDHLVLVPKPGTAAARRCKRADYWLDDQTGLFRQIRTEDDADRILTVRFKDIRTNSAVKAKDELFERGKLPDKWEESVNDHTTGGEAPPAGK